MSARWDWGRLKPSQKDAVPDGRTSSPRGYSYSIRGGPPPARPPREFVASRSYETATPVREPTPRNPSRNTYRDSSFRPPSSLYSQPPAVDTNSYRHVSAASGTPFQYGGAADDISPPSSPEPGYTTNDRFRGQSRDVSPMDEDFPASSHPPRSSSRNAGSRPSSTQPAADGPRTSIPMMRRARRKESDAALREAHERERAAAQHQQAQHQPAPRKEVRWGTMTGEPTTGTQDRPSQAHAVSSSHGQGPADSGSSPPPAQPHLRSPTATAMASFGDKVKRMTQAGKGERRQDRIVSATEAADPAALAFSSPSSRPGWRGASGRTALVDPVRDNTQVTPLKIPKKSSKRVAPPAPVSTAPTRADRSLGPASSRQTPPVSPPAPETAARPAAPRQAPRSPSHFPSRQPAPGQQGPGPARDQSYPSPPLSGTPDRAAAPRQSDGHGRRSAGGPSSQDTPPEDTAQASIRRKPPPSSSFSSSPSPASAHPGRDPQNPTQAQPGADTSDPWVQPPSRFSVTTYATSAAATPRASSDGLDPDRPPVPTPPQQYRDGTGAQPKPKPKPDSVMDRKRPKLDGGDERLRQPTASSATSAMSPIVISFKDSYASTASPSSVSPSPAAATAARGRKAVASGAGAGKGIVATAAGVARARAAERPLSSASSVKSDINKSLPPAPPEASADEARDRVGILDAQLRSLGNRRINLNRCIKQMTELMPQDNVLDSAEVVYKRELEKKKVETLRVELADVQRQEYELGLKLHRAYKRMDRDADWERSALWVRRVTG